VIEETHLPVPEPVAEPCLQLVRFEDGKLGLRFAHYHGRRWGRDPLVLVVTLSFWSRMTSPTCAER
jgi:hypothetical protein